MVVGPILKLSIFLDRLNMASPTNVEKPALVVEGDGQKEERRTVSSIISDDSVPNPTGIDEKALVRHLDWKLLPPLTLLYLLSFLDRSNGM